MTREEFKKYRMNVWVDAWIHVASAANCDKMDSPAKWADQCLSDFDKRFVHSIKEEV